MGAYRKPHSDLRTVTNMLTRYFPALLHLTVVGHIMVAVTVVTVVAFVLMVAGGDDWNATPDDFDNWETI